MFFSVASIRLWGLVLLGTVLSLTLSAQPLLINAFSMGGSGTDVAWSSYPDEEGNYYICGTFSGTVDFDPSANTSNLSSNGARDAFFAKYDSSDALVWAKQIGTANGTKEEASFLLTDRSGNIVVGFDLTDVNPVDMDPNAGVSSIALFGQSTVYAKYDSDGNLIWAKYFANGFISYFEIDDDNNILIPLRYNGACDLDPGTGSVSQSLQGVKDASLVKLDSAGNYVWGIPLATTGSDKIGGMDIDANGNIYISGRLGGTGSWDIDPDTSTNNISGPSGYLAKYDSDGKLVWGLADPNFSLTKLRINIEGNIVVGGSISGTVDLDLDTSVAQYSSSGNRDAFMARYDTVSCAFVDALVFGSSQQDGVNSFVTDEQGYYYITGDVTDAVDFDPGARQVILSNTGRNAYIAKFDTGFNLVWAEIFPFFLNGTSKGQMNVDANGDLIIAAGFENNAYMDFDPPSYNVKSQGGDDIVVARYRQLTTEAVPTLPEWAMIFLAACFCLMGVRTFSRI